MWHRRLKRRQRDTRENASSMRLPTAHLSQLRGRFLKGRQTNVPFAWSLILLLVVAFLLPYFLFSQLFDEADTYGSLALAPLFLAAYLRERQGVLITWGLILLGIACSQWIHDGMNWSHAELNNFFFGDLTGLILGFSMAQYFYMRRQTAAVRLEAEQQRQARELQEQLNSLKDQLLLHLSHELRTPLTTIQGCLELLSTYRDQLDEEQRIKFFEGASQGCLDLLNLITNLLDVNKLGEQQDLPLEPVALAQFVRDMVEQSDPRSRQEYQVEVEVAEDILVQATPQYLLQVLRNLFSNALKYSPPHSRIVIGAAIESAAHREKATLPTVCISVKDEGPGISPTEISLLFNKFTRLKRDLNGPVPGTGLGLYICKQLVEAMGGRIWVESSGRVGEGSRFCFLLLSAASPGVWSKGDDGASRKMEPLPMPGAELKKQTLTK